MAIENEGGTMQLIVSGLDNAPIRFKHLWGRYVLGFRPWKHCIGCFESKKASSINPQMKDGLYDLKDEFGLFYLCGVGQPDTKRTDPGMLRQRTNVHLAARPQLGSTAAIGSVYGVGFVLKDAEAIPIQSLPEGFRDLTREHYRCKNFQFGYQMFDSAEVGDNAPREIVRHLRANTIGGPG
jgi:hypothetical protein